MSEGKGFFGAVSKLLGLGSQKLDKQEAEKNEKKEIEEKEKKTPVFEAQEVYEKRKATELFTEESKDDEDDDEEEAGGMDEFLDAFDSNEGKPKPEFKPPPKESKKPEEKIEAPKQESKPISISVEHLDEKTKKRLEEIEREIANEEKFLADKSDIFKYNLHLNKKVSLESEKKRLVEKVKESLKKKAPKEVKKSSAETEKKVADLEKQIQNEEELMNHSGKENLFEYNVHLHKKLTFVKEREEILKSIGENRPLPQFEFKEKSAKTTVVPKPVAQQSSPAKEPVLDLSDTSKSCPNHPHLLAVWKNSSGEKMCYYEAAGIPAPSDAKEKVPSGHKEITVDTVVGKQTWLVKTSTTKSAETGPLCKVFFDPVSPALAAIAICKIGKLENSYSFVPSSGNELIMENGDKLTVSSGIARYLAKKHKSLNLYDADNVLLSTQIDGFVELALQLKNPDHFEKHCKTLDSHIASTKSEFLVGKNFTFADLIVWESLVLVAKKGKGVPPMKNLKKWFDNCSSKPELQEAIKLSEQPAPSGKPSLDSPEKREYVNRAMEDFGISKEKAEEIWNNFMGPVLGVAPGPAKDLKQKIAEVEKKQKDVLSKAKNLLAKLDQMTGKPVTQDVSKLEKRQLTILDQLNQIEERLHKIDGKGVSPVSVDFDSQGKIKSRQEKVIKDLKALEQRISNLEKGSKPGVSSTTQKKEAQEKPKKENKKKEEKKQDQKKEKQEKKEPIIRDIDDSMVAYYLALEGVQETTPQATVDEGKSSKEVSEVVKILEGAFATYIDKNECIQADYLKRIVDSPNQVSFLREWFQLYSKKSSKEEIFQFLEKNPTKFASFGSVSFALKNILFKKALEVSSNKEESKEIPKSSEKNPSKNPSKKSKDKPKVAEKQKIETKTQDFQSPSSVTKSILEECIREWAKETGTELSEEEKNELFLKLIPRVEPKVVSLSNLAFSRGKASRLPKRTRKHEKQMTESF